MTKKRRNKRYQGQDAKQDRPVIKHYSVEDTSKFKRWLEDHKPELIVRGVQAGLVGVVGLIIYLLGLLIF